MSFSAAANSRGREARRRRMADPAYRAELSENMRRVQAVRWAAPRWVPPHLVGEFCDFAQLYGEERACAHVRAMKRAEEG